MKRCWSVQKNFNKLTQEKHAYRICSVRIPDFCFLKPSFQRAYIPGGGLIFRGGAYISGGVGLIFRGCLYSGGGLIFRGGGLIFREGGLIFREGAYKTGGGGLVIRQRRYLQWFVIGGNGWIWDFPRSRPSVAFLRYVSTAELKSSRRWIFWDLIERLNSW